MKTEIEILKNFKHPNIISFRNCYPYKILGNPIKSKKILGNLRNFYFWYGTHTMGNIKSAEYKDQDAFAMEVANCALSDMIEKAEISLVEKGREIGGGIEEIHFGAKLIKQMITGD